MDAPPRPPRRTQAERSDETRLRLLEAAIRCLHGQGYAATTTLLVAREAGLSRGAMLHQFPTKVDLMLYVVRTVYDREIAEYRLHTRAIRDPREHLLTLPLIAWEVLSRPSGVAVLEILQGSRSDPDLAERLRPLQNEIERDSFVHAENYRHILGDIDPPAFVRLVVWTVRGLSIAQVLAADGEDPGKPVKLLARLLGGQI